MYIHRLYCMYACRIKVEIIEGLALMLLPRQLAITREATTLSSLYAPPNQLGLLL